MNLRHFKAAHAIEKRHYDTAIKAYEEALKINDKDTYALGMLAYCYEWKEDMKIAIEYADKALMIDPTDFLILSINARCWFALEDMDKTYHYVCRLLENPPEPLLEIKGKGWFNRTPDNFAVCFQARAWKPKISRLGLIRFDHQALAESFPVAFDLFIAQFTQSQSETIQGH